MKRIVLFLLTNLLVVVTLSVVASVLGINRWVTENGIDFGALLMFAFLFGFGGAFISLLISKPVAKWSMRARVITGNEGSAEAWLVQTVARLAQSAGIRTPEVAVYEGAPNAFATGAFKNSALVAVSTGLLQQMDRSQVEAVLGHEVAHVANGDMVTLALIQGVMNTFVIFVSRVVGYAIDRVLLKNTSDAPGVGYYVSVIVLDILFGLLAALVVAWFSRQREFRADAGSARLLGQPAPMISALQALGRMQGGNLPSNLQAFGITAGERMRQWAASHPPLEKRIAALQERTFA